MEPSKDASLGDEAAYEALRRNQRIWRLTREQRLSRRAALEQLARGALASAAVASGFSWSRPLQAQEAPLPPIVKPTPEDAFRILGTNRETLWEALKDSGYLTPESLFFIRNHTTTPRI